MTNLHIYTCKLMSSSGHCILACFPLCDALKVLVVRILPPVLLDHTDRYVQQIRCMGSSGLQMSTATTYNAKCFLPNLTMSPVFSSIASSSTISKMYGSRTARQVSASCLCSLLCVVSGLSLVIKIEWLLDLVLFRWIGQETLGVVCCCCRHGRRRGLEAAAAHLICSVWSRGTGRV